MLCARAQLPRRDFLYFSDSEGLALLRKPWPSLFLMLDLLDGNAQRIVVRVYHCCTVPSERFSPKFCVSPCITFTQRM
jgi:hypothetical protein